MATIKPLKQLGAVRMGDGANSIFEFWSRCRRSDNIHPDDQSVFDRLGSRGHKFDLRCLPGHFMGPLKTAPVVMLFMSPGLDSWDVDFAATDQGKDWHVKQRTGLEPLPLNKRSPTVEWWTARTKLYGVSVEQLAERLAFLNIGAYHSKDMVDPELLAALPSSRASLDWAQHVLFPEAEAGRRVVICCRAAKFWGLTSGNAYSGTLFAPPMVRGGHMRRGNYRDRVIQEVRTKLAAHR